MGLQQGYVHDQMRKIVLLAVLVIAVIGVAHAKHFASEAASGVCDKYGVCVKVPRQLSAAGAAANVPSGSLGAPAGPLFRVVRLRPMTQTSGCTDGVLPDRQCSPGAVFAGVSTKQICVSGYTAKVRDVPYAEKKLVYERYGITSHAPRQYEVDHIVSLELGGSNDVANLYPELYDGSEGAHTKDKVENALNRQVCDGKLTIRQAQTLIATDWRAGLRYVGR